MWGYEILSPVNKSEETDMQGEVIVLFLSQPINELPINVSKEIHSDDIVTTGEDCGYVVRVNDVDNGNSVEVQYIVTTEEGHEFIVPKSYINRIEFATEDEEMMYTKSFNQLVYNDEVDSLAKLVSGRITQWISDDLTPDTKSCIIEDLVEKINKRILK